MNDSAGPSGGRGPGAGGRRLKGLRAFYHLGEPVALTAPPAGTAELVATTAAGRTYRAVEGDGFHFPELPAGTLAVEARGPGGDLLADEFTTVAAHPGQRPVHGFATSFVPEAVPGVLGWLESLRCTVVQIYDWMHQYCAPLGPREGWRDPSHREVSFEALGQLARGLRAQGAVAHAYAPVYAMDVPFAAEHPDMLMFQGDGQPERFFDLIQLADPANAAWRSHFARVYGDAADAIGFNGFHLDTYGYPRAPVDASGHPIDMRAAYEGFLGYFRSARPRDQVSFNQVNGVPSAISLPPGPGFRYCEVWPPNDQWRHLEGLMDRSAGQAGLREDRAGAPSPLRGTIALYPPVWGTGDGEEHVEGPARAGSLRTVVLTEAVATALGGAALLYGDLDAVLCDPYYPKHERLDEAEVATALTWHRFALRVRDLFLAGEDTSWYDVADDNGAVAVRWAGGCARPEPSGEAVFARVVRDRDRVAVSVIDLTGSARGAWSEPTAAGHCGPVTVRCLVEKPSAWRAAVAVLGRDHGRFQEVPFGVVGHREGSALEVEVPMGSGWSVLRVTR